jgi:chemotaxis protein MotB
MIRKFLAMAAVFAAAGGLAGCAGQGAPVTDMRLQTENNKLKQQISGLEGEKAQLKQSLTDSQTALGEAKLNAEEWRSRYEAAKTALPESASPLPAELLRKFIDIAQAGGPFELGPTGSLKASSDILFDSGKIILKPAGEGALKEIAPKLAEILTDKRVMLRVDGHTDNTPIRYSGWDDNLHLSIMRARVVVNSLSKQGVPANTMFAAGFGEHHPVAGNDTKEGRDKNRRVELTLISVTPLLPETQR